MAKDVINVDGENIVTREDTARGARGVNWAIVSMAAFVVIAAIMFFFFFWGSTRKDGSIGNTPSTQDTSPR